MSSLIEQLQQIEQQKRVLISGVLDEIRQRIELLNAAGFRYRLVDESAAPDKGRGTGGQRRKTSQEAFLSKVRAASFRKWGKLRGEERRVVAEGRAAGEDVLQRELSRWGEYDGPQVPHGALASHKIDGIRS